MTNRAMIPIVLLMAFAVEDADLIPAHVRRKPKKKSHAFPPHLPRVEHIVDVPDADQTCPEHGEKELLPEAMWDVREKLVTIPPQYEVHIYKYKKYACKGQPQCGIASAERPTGIVEGDKYDTSVATQIITHKYGYFLTLYRLQNLFPGSGWTPSRSLLLNILTNCYFIIEPLLNYFKQTLQRSPMERSCALRVTRMHVASLKMPKTIRPIGRSGWTGSGCCTTWSRKPVSSLTGDALLTARRAKQRPVWELMRAELNAVDDRTEQVVLPKSDLRKALKLRSQSLDGADSLSR